MNVTILKNARGKGNTIFMLMLTLAWMLLFPFFSFADTQTTPLLSTAVSDRIGLVVNGTELQLDQSPILDGNRVLVPVRGIFEQMGASVSWDSHTNTATIQKGAVTVLLNANCDTASVNGTKYKLDVPAKLQNGRLLVPVRFISEHLGMTVNWDQEKKIVTVSDGQTAVPEQSHESEITFHLPHFTTSFESPIFLSDGILYYCGQDQGLVQCYSAPFHAPQNASLILSTDVLASASPDPGGNEFHPDFFEKSGQVFFHYRVNGAMNSSDQYFVIGKNGSASSLSLQHSNAVIEPYGDSRYVYLTSAFGDSDLYLRGLKDSEQRIGDPYYNYIGNLVVSGDSLFVAGFPKGGDQNKPDSSLWQINLETNQIHQLAQNCSNVLGVYGSDLYFLSRDQKLQKIASSNSKPILTTLTDLPVKLAQMEDDSLYFVDSSDTLNVLNLKSGVSKKIMKPSAGKITKIETNGNLVAVSYSESPNCTLAIFDENGTKRFSTNQPVAYDTFDQDHVVYTVQNSDLIHGVSLH